MKKWFVLPVALLFAGSASAQEVVQLKFGSAVPAMSWPTTMGIVPWTEMVEKDSGGAVKFTVFAGGGVVTSKNGYDRLNNGIVDALYGTISDMPGQFPRTDVTSMPFEVNKAVDASRALWRLYDKGVVSMEWTAVHPLALFVFNASRFHANKPITKAEDLKGVKVALFSRTHAQMVSEIGGTPVTASTTEIYETMNRGLAQICVMGWTGVQTFKLDEVTKFHLEAPLGASPGYMLMNKETYAKLPAKVKDAVDKNAGLPFAIKMGVNSDTVESNMRERVRGLAGHTVAELPPEELARWRQMSKPVVDEWIKNTPDGEKVLAAYRAELADIRSGK
jgi:TRAP-type C4-dicarboxylate transport system substrate-binding protein